MSENKTLNAVEIVNCKTKDGFQSTELFIDGVEVKGIRKIEFIRDLHNPPVLKVEMICDFKELDNDG